MKVKEFVSNLSNDVMMEIRNEKSCTICICYTDSEEVKPYEEREIDHWFINSVHIFESAPSLCIDLKEEEVTQEVEIDNLPDDAIKEADKCGTLLSEWAMRIGMALDLSEAQQMKLLDKISLSLLELVGEKKGG